MTLYYVLDTGVTVAPLLSSVEVIGETRRYYLVPESAGLSARGRILKERVDLSPEQVEENSRCMATSPYKAWALALQRARVKEANLRDELKDAERCRRRLEREVTLRNTVGTANLYP